MMTINTTVVQCTARLLQQLDVCPSAVLPAAVEVRREALCEALREEPSRDGVVHVNAVRDDGNLGSFDPPLPF